MENRQFLEGLPAHWDPAFWVYNPLAPPRMLHHPGFLPRLPHHVRGYAYAPYPGYSPIYRQSMTLGGQSGMGTMPQPQQGSYSSGVSNGGPYNQVRQPYNSSSGYGGTSDKVLQVSKTEYNHWVWSKQN